MGRVKPKWPDSQRFHIKMPDGATMSYDLFDPHEEGEKGINFKNRGNQKSKLSKMHIATDLLIIS